MEFLPPLDLPGPDTFWENELDVTMLVCIISLVYALFMTYIHVKKSDPKSKHKMKAEKPIAMDYSSQNEEDTPLLADSGTSFLQDIS